MSGIYIKGMEMPKSPVLFCVHPDGKVFADLEGGWREYQAVPVPQHGRMCDMDSKTFPTPHRNPSNDYMRGWNACLRGVQQQPTIIPSDKEEIQ